MKYTNYKILVVNNNLFTHTILETDKLSHNHQFLHNSYIIGRCIRQDWFYYYESTFLFNEIWSVLNKNVKNSYCNGNFAYIDINKDILKIYDLTTENDDDVFCCIETIEFLKLALINYEANWYIRKAFKKEQCLSIEWIEEQWKLIEKYENQL